MTDFVRTPDSNFAALTDFPYEPRYHQWHDLRMHYIDEGPRDGPVVLMTHGMPTWGYLYRDIIPPLLAAGYRCVAPDHMGFGRSDKPTDSHWYSIARHTEVLTSLIVALDLNTITLMCQDWGGPTGLAQAAMMPERFERLTIMNTWLHHDEFVYSDAIRSWNRNWHEGGLFSGPTPDVALLLVLSAGLIEQKQMIEAFAGGAKPELTGDAACIYEGFSAPYKGMSDDAYNGLRRFPLSICFDNYDGGNGAAQTSHYRALLGWTKPVHFIWGCADDVFTQEWGETWAEKMGNASFDRIAEAGHFLQNSHGAEVVQHLLRRIGQE